VWSSQSESSIFRYITTLLLSRRNSARLDTKRNRKKVLFQMRAIKVGQRICWIPALCISSLLPATHGAEFSPRLASANPRALPDLLSHAIGENKCGFKPISQSRSSDRRVLCSASPASSVTPRPRIVFLLNLPIPTHRHTHPHCVWAYTRCHLEGYVAGYGSGSTIDLHSSGGGGCSEMSKKSLKQQEQER